MSAPRAPRPISTDKHAAASPAPKTPSAAVQSGIRGTKARSLTFSTLWHASGSPDAQTVGTGVNVGMQLEDCGVVELGCIEVLGAIVVWLDGGVVLPAELSGPPDDMLGP